MSEPTCVSAKCLLRAVQEAPGQTQPGEIVEIESEEELDSILQERKDTLIVLLGSLTWCRPCKTLAKPLQVRASFPQEQAQRDVHASTSLSVPSPAVVKT